jgi:integrase
MSRHRFTTRFIKSIKPPRSGRAEYWDTSLAGFGLRVTQAGRKTWFVRYRHNGRLLRYTVGTYPTLELADAREQAGDVLHAVAKGRDPQAEKRAESRAETFRELADEYLEKHAKKRKRSWRKDELAIERDLLPAFSHRKAKSIKRQDVIRLLEGIVERGAPIQANRTLEILRKMFNWAVAREVVEVNPCAMVEKPSPEHRRDRVLSDPEIMAVWQATETEKTHAQAMYRLLLLTAQRPGEVPKMRWPDIAGEWWTIPGEFTKNGLPHRVPLSSQARAILKEIKPESQESPWVFPSPRKEAEIGNTWKATVRIRDRATVLLWGQDGDARVRRLLARLRRKLDRAPTADECRATAKAEKIELPPGFDFVPHDLRRTAASRMTGDLGISRLTVSKVLNHTESGVTAVYDRHSYDREKREALTAWGRRLERIVSAQALAEPKVVELRTA